MKKMSSSMYLIMYILSKQGKCNSKWLQNVENLIKKNEFGHIWQDQNNINIKWFNLAFKQKIHDQYLQTWQSVPDQSSSSINDRLFKTQFGCNNYFTYLSNSDCRKLTAFRTRNHRFPVETGRWRGQPLTERLCQLYKSDIGDEYHYIMKCETFKEQRIKFLKRYYITHPNTMKFAELMNTNDRAIIKNMCKFISVIMKNVNAIIA